MSRGYLTLLALSAIVDASDNDGSPCLADCAEYAQLLHGAQFSSPDFYDFYAGYNLVMDELLPGVNVEG